MTGLFDKLNLRPGERRLVVVGAVIVFVVLNFWLVFPHFGDLARVQQQTRDARKKLELFQGEIRKEQDYQREMKRLAEQGASVAQDAQALELQREVSSQALASGVVIQRFDSTSRSSTTRSNAFFDEQSIVITVQSGEKELVDFLHNLAERSSLIRVRQMSIQPEPARHRLQGSITLVASYQKKAPTRATTPAAVGAAASRTGGGPAPAAKAPPAVPPSAPASAAKPASPTNVPVAKTASPAPAPSAGAPAKSGKAAPPTASDTSRVREVPKRTGLPIPPPTK